VVFSPGNQSVSALPGNPSHIYRAGCHLSSWQLTNDWHGQRHSARQATMFCNNRSLFLCIYTQTIFRRVSDYNITEYFSRFRIWECKPTLESPLLLPPYPFLSFLPFVFPPPLISHPFPFPLLWCCYHDVVIARVIVCMQDKRCGLQAHVDEREQGQNNSINTLQIKLQKLQETHQEIR